MATEPQHRLTADDLREMVEGEREESSTLDFKQELWTKRDSDQPDWKEMCKDITAMANAHGGLIIIGIEEKNGIATKLNGQDIDDSLLQSISNSCRNRIQEPISELDPYPVDLPESGKRALVFNIPNSPLKPHVVKDNGRFRCYKRVGTINSPCDLGEIREMVLYTEAGHRRAREYFDEWLSRHYSDSKWDIIVALIPTVLLQPVLFDRSDLESLFGEPEIHRRRDPGFPFYKGSMDKEFFIDGVRARFRVKVAGGHWMELQTSEVHERGLITVVNSGKAIQGFCKRNGTGFLVPDLLRPLWRALLLHSGLQMLHSSSARHELLLLITDPQGFPFTVGTNQGGYEPIGAEYKEEKLQLSAGVFDPSKSFEEVLAPLTERIVRAFGTDHCPFVKDGRLTRDTVESLWV